MESKVCTYTEKNIRLQLVRVYVEYNSQWILELRFNRSVIRRWVIEEIEFARLYFSHCISKIVVDRSSDFMSKITLESRARARTT